MPVRLRAVLVAGLLLAGCATKAEPPTPGTAPAGTPVAGGAPADIRPPVRMLTEAQFDEAMRAALAPADAYQEERNYTAVMNRPDVTPDQKARVLYMRAVLRGSTTSNLNGALADYEALMKLIQPGHPLYQRAVNGKAYGERQRETVNNRIARGPAAQAATAYLDDLLFLGRHREAVIFVKGGQVQPTSLQIEKLAKLGYLCEGAGYAGAVYRWGSPPRDVRWCDTRAGGAPGTSR